MDRRTFFRSSILARMEALRDEGECVGEVHGPQQARLFFQLDGFFALLELWGGDMPGIRVVGFTERHALFGDLLAALPVRPEELLVGTA